LLSVYDKDGLIPFAQGLKELGFRLLGSGGTARMIREAGIEIECADRSDSLAENSTRAPGTSPPSPKSQKCSVAE